MPDGSERNRGEQLRMAARTDDGAYRALLSAPALPDAVAHVWYWWLALHSRRQHAGMAVLPITEERVFAFAALEGITFIPGELDILWAIERCYFRVQTKQAEPQDGGING